MYKPQRLLPLREPPVPFRGCDVSFFSFTFPLASCHLAGLLSLFNYFSPNTHTYTHSPAYTQMHIHSHSHTYSHTPIHTRKSCPKQLCQLLPLLRCTPPLIWPADNQPTLTVLLSNPHPHPRDSGIRGRQSLLHLFPFM